MAYYTWEKDPLAKLDYSIDWGENWLADGETIATSTWTVGTGLTKVSEDKTDTITTVWVSGGNEGDEIYMDNVIATSEGREERRRVKVIIKIRGR